MNAAEAIDEQLPGYVPRRFDPCSCDAVHGVRSTACHCYDDDGEVSHGGCEVERLEHEATGYPRKCR